jgi:hypothetical protein
MSQVNVVIGAGSIGKAILRQENADATAKVLKDAGFEVSVATDQLPDHPEGRTLQRA